MTGLNWSCKKTAQFGSLLHRFFPILFIFKKFFILYFKIIIIIYLFCSFFLTLQYCIGFAIYQHESATGIHVLPVLNPLPSFLPVPSLWVVPVHQGPSIVHRTWTCDLFHIWYYTSPWHAESNSTTASRSPSFCLPLSTSLLWFFRPQLPALTLTLLLWLQ